MAAGDLGVELERVFCRHGRSLFVCALAITRSRELAEDAVQEAFYRLFRMTAVPEDVKAYVYRAVRNAAVDQVTRSPVSGESIEESFFDPGENPQQAAARGEFEERVEEVLRRMSPDERETILQHLYGDLTFREIAELRDVSINTVTSWYRRGIEKLRTELEHEYRRIGNETAQA
ncbi:MAG: sigma-70 family RNA polymerase sigma factor [Candidatus Hydrogenedentes bacterium]|nr:sigma-70 family RNA polymerase sigma factor [Candidatus Hydrogenedentota bacterium]